MSDMKVIKIAQKYFLWTFWGFLVNFLHSLGVWFFDIWHLFDNLISFEILTHYIACTPLPMCAKPLYPIAPCVPLSMCPTPHTPLSIPLYPIVKVAHTPCNHYPLCPIAHVAYTPCTPYPLYTIAACAPLPMYPITPVPYWAMGNGSNGIQGVWATWGKNSDHLTLGATNQKSHKPVPHFYPVQDVPILTLHTHRASLDWPLTSFLTSQPRYKTCSGPSKKICDVSISNCKS